MQIDRMEIENFKSHVKSTIIFSPGLNLILGSNGSGKTSILQALGFAIAGVKWEGNYKDLITNFNGSKSALVKVSFIANDGLNYTVTRVIKERQTTWELSSSNNVAWKGQVDVLETLKHLLGIEGKVDEIYKRVITAHQNDMTSIFSMQPSKRKEFFDELFNTKIYQEIAQKEMKEYVGKIEKEEARVEASINSLKDALQAMEDTKKSIEDFTKDLKKMRKNADLLSNLKEERNRKLERLQAMKKELESLERKKEAFLKDIEEKNKRILVLQERLKKSFMAKKACEDTKRDHDEYEVLYQEVEKSERFFSLLEGKVEELRKKEKELNKIEREKAKLESAIPLLVDKEEKIKKEIVNLQDKIHTKKLEIEENVRKTKSFSSEMNKLSLKVEKEKSVFQAIDELTNEVLEIESRKKEIMRTLPDSMEKVNEKIKKLESEVNLLKHEEEELKVLYDERSTLREKMRSLDESKKSLENGVCPILDEECQNLKGKAVSDYFAGKQTVLAKKINEINEKIKKLEKEKIALKETEKTLVRVKKEKEEFENNIKRVEGLENEKGKKLLSLKQLLKLEFEDILEAKQFKQKSLKELEMKVATLIERKNEMEKRIKISRTELEEMLTTLKLKEEELKDDISKKNNHFEKIRDLENKRSTFVKALFTLEIEETKLKSLKEKMALKRKKMKSLKVSYDKYNENKQLATELDSIKFEVETLEKEKRETESNLSDVEKKLESFSKDYNANEEEELKKELDEIYKRESEYNVRVGQLNGKLEELTKRYEELKEKEMELEKLKDEYGRIKSKKKFMEELRKVLNGMGSEVAQRYRDHIAIKATMKYRALTGRPDKIKWGNNYAVHLITPLATTFSDRYFSQLSGGEQMMVALSIRAALNETFSKSRFVIFDEPTVNLDENRREALSEYLPQLFGNMEQVIVVTHDETFREVAEKVIFVEKENGASIVS